MCLPTSRFVWWRISPRTYHHTPRGTTRSQVIGLYLYLVGGISCKVQTTQTATPAPSPTWRAALHSLSLFLLSPGSGPGLCHKSNISVLLWNKHESFRHVSWIYNENNWLWCHQKFAFFPRNLAKIQDGGQARDMVQLTFFLWEINSKFFFLG